VKLSVKNLVLLLVVLAGSASTCLYWSRYTDAVHVSLAHSSGLRGKALTDLYPSWYATRELLLHHRNPYGAEVNHELQIAYYGKVLDPSRPEERVNEQRFAYPLYFIFFIAPMARIQFQTVRIIFWWLLAAGAAINVLLWLRFLRLRWSLPALIVLFLFVLTSVPVLQNLAILQPFLLAAGFIAGAAAAAASRRLFLAGALLALATVKPQISLLPLVWFALWFVSDFKSRLSLLWGFATMLATLILTSEWLLPGWLIQYPRVLEAYAEYTRSMSLLATILPGPVHWLVTIFVVAMVAEFCWGVRQEPADSTAFAIALSFVLALTVLIVPAMVQPFNHVLLLPAVLLAIRYWRELRQGNAVTRAVTSVFCLCAFLPWLLAVVAISRPLTPGSDWLLKIWSVPLAASMALPFAAFGVLILLRKVTPPRSASLCIDNRLPL
jgi:hypothetical protein